MRNEYCEKDGISVTYSAENVGFEDVETTEALLVDNNGRILLNNFDEEKTTKLMAWYHRIYRSILYFRSLDRMEKFDYTKWQRKYFDRMPEGAFTKQAREYAMTHPCTGQGKEI